MLNNEGTWLVPVLRKSGADLEEQAVIGPIPLYEEADKNKLPIEVLTVICYVKAASIQKKRRNF